MMSKKVTFAPHKPLSEGAVDGLFAGLAGGIAMVVYVLVAVLASGVLPGEVIAYLTSDETQWVNTLLLHFSVASVYGLFLGIAWQALGAGRSHGGSVLVGLLYGFVLWLAAHLLILPQGVLTVPIPSLHFALAHLVYGVTTAWLLQQALDG